MLSNKFRVLIAFLGLVLIVSCKTYTVTVDSFKNQMKQSSASKLVEVNDPLFGGNIIYYSNDISSLTVLNKDGIECILPNSPSIEMRVTHNNGKRFIVYFDTVVLENGFLKGSRSRFMSKLSKSIPIDSVIKIEIQDGGKKFNYK